MGERMNTDEKINELERKIDDNFERIIANMDRLHSHEERINRNTSAIDVLHTIKTYNNRFFYMWLITFIALIISVVFNLC